jgi:ORF6N domain
MAGEELAPIEHLIVTIHDQRVMLAGDLAQVYGVQTRVLNQAVRRHAEKFSVQDHTV